MPEIDEFQTFHPRAVKLLRKKKNFLVVAVDEPYYLAVYALIRAFEIAKGTWSNADEALFARAPELRDGAVGGDCTDPVNGTGDSEASSCTEEEHDDFYVSGYAYCPKCHQSTLPF